MDDNKEILELIEKRMELGKKRYGHGVIVDDDTTKYGTETNDWEMMLLEEVLDAQVYCAAAMLRLMRNKKK